MKVHGRVDVKSLKVIAQIPVGQVPTQVATVTVDEPEP